MEKIGRVLAAFAVICLLGSCHKAVLDCNFIIQPKSQIAEKDDFYRDVNTIAFYFKADTMEYTVASYQDAIKGVLTARNNPGTMAPTAYASFDPATEHILFPSITERTVVVVACDTALKMYAIRQVEFVKDLEQLIVPLTFKPWKFIIEEPDDDDDNEPGDPSTAEPVEFYKEAGWIVRIQSE